MYLFVLFSGQAVQIFIIHKITIYNIKENFLSQQGSIHTYKKEHAIENDYNSL